MAVCPDNSKECLLRAILADNSTQALFQRLLDADSRFNWDPLNFAFTAAIGMLALLFACVTVFQGLLAAGPGRLKASRAAIGDFSDRSISKFNRIELGLRTTAYVPYLSRERLSEVLRGEHGYSNTDYLAS